MPLAVAAAPCEALRFLEKYECRTLSLTGRQRRLLIHSDRRNYMGIQVAMTVNGKAAKADIDPRTLLVEFIRNDLALTGTHVGCDTGQCGACTVLIGGNAVKACTILAVQAEAANVTTIEGLATNGEMHPMQAAFKECHGLQCGFCTPGMVMSAIDLVQRHPNADESTIRAELEGNLCRCTGYQNIVKAVAQGAAAMRR
jgi:carbon-monoxide dehydrogenase small subunit